MRLFFGLVVLLAGAAQADERFAKLDIDGDGRLSLAEIAGNADLVKGFDRADRNKDGKLTLKEYDALVARATGQSAASGATGPQKPAKKKKRN